MSTRDAARARWRADLHDFGAAALNSAGLTGLATDNAASAFSLREYADLMDSLAAAKAAGDPVALRAVKTEVIAFRAAERTFGPPRVGVVSDFPEPSDDELAASGY